MFFLFLYPSRLLGLPILTRFLASLATYTPSHLLTFLFLPLPPYHHLSTTAHSGVRPLLPFVLSRPMIGQNWSKIFKIKKAPRGLDHNFLTHPWVKSLQPLMALLFFPWVLRVAAMLLPTLFPLFVVLETLLLWYFLLEYASLPSQS